MTTIADLPAPERRRLFLHSGLRVLGTTLAFVILYGATPIPADTRAGTIVGLTIGLLVFFGLVIYQIRAIIVADHPALRAVEAVAVSVPLILVVFAFTYLSMARNDPATFSEHLDHVGAMYFTITVLGTVGFGDIVPVTDGARIAVSIQMLIDFLVLVSVLRAVMYAARLGMSRKKGESPPL